ncbi:DUF4232 domain-containing protein [Actinacidiphila bryophytorum]|uniref:DUF4232 domain-containing protein n=1 Tax=Actinacidiphila bryophytorum TaxID=1436133 RepID=A0A9W4H320_9ACTN|nr:DUF4232 domain-containing protein [Actinacidiphila bryophytorum]MBM9437135.1 DUF4232 domain-containing protein [Actinacidiphila bryophytorum]MBN6545823.1 DUF4232 domain-containing protein [Actinacidiphila bryophytorum]CAG7646790.1 conserved hypothetical protein [Actinacidiphila bryophytorum]
MTGFPDPRGDAPDGDGAAPAEPLLRQPPGYLDAPPGAFAQIRRRAARRRRVRAAGGGLAAAVVLTGSVYLVGAMTSHGSDDVVSPPASNSLTSAATSAPTPTRGTAPTPTPGTTAPPGTGTRGPTATGTPTPDPAPTRTGPASGSGATPMCATSQLTAALGGGDAGAGSLFRYLVLTNHSSTACHLTGYPGLSMLDADGRQIGAPADRQPMAYSAVVLRPGGSVSDTIHTVNQQGTCLPASVKLRIYPPGNTAWLDFPGSVTNCDNLFTVTPFAAGRTGNPPS